MLMRLIYTEMCPVCIRPRLAVIGGAQAIRSGVIVSSGTAVLRPPQSIVTLLRTAHTTSFGALGPYLSAFLENIQSGVTGAVRICYADAHMDVSTYSRIARIFLCLRPAA